MIGMEGQRLDSAGASVHTAEVRYSAKEIHRGSASDPREELEAALSRLEQARARMYSAALAFCDGTISAGQLRAVRELLRESEQRASQLEGRQPQPFVEEVTQPSAIAHPEVVTATPLSETTSSKEVLSDGTSPELRRRLEALDEKTARLEQDFQQGRINASQYRAIHRHYVEQQEVALRLHQSHPESDRWKVVLEEGKTSFLLQLNEASCMGVGFYDINTKSRLHLQGEMPASAEEAMSLLGTFGSAGGDAPAGRMLATQSEDGTTLLLIPGRFTAALVVFSQDPPGWQVRALREVHQNFEAANRLTLDRGHLQFLIYPDLSRFIRD
jgi:hypothetical protein